MWLTAGRAGRSTWILRRRWRSTTFEPVEIIGQGRGQFDDPPLEGATQQIELDLGTGRDVLVPGQHDDAARRNVPLELPGTRPATLRRIRLTRDPLAARLGGSAAHGGPADHWEILSPH